MELSLFGENQEKAEGQLQQQSSEGTTVSSSKQQSSGGVYRTEIRQGYVQTSPEAYQFQYTI